MKLKLRNYSVFDAETSSPKIGATLSILFADSDIQISGDIGLTFDHPSPLDLNFSEVEKLATEKVKSQLV